MASYSDYVDSIRSGIYKPTVRIELLRDDETVESVLSGDVLSGTLSINRNNGVRRTCSVTFVATEDLLPNVYGIWAKRKFKLWLGLETDNGEYLKPQGVFVVTNPSYNSTPTDKIVTINGIDKFCLFNGEIGGVLKDIYQVGSGTNVNNAVITIIQEFGDVKNPILDLSTQTFPYDIRKGQDENIGDMLKEIAYFSSRNIFYNENGELVFEDDVDDNIKGSLWDFNDSYDKFSYLGSDVEYKFDGVKNVVKVIGNNVNGTTVQYTAINNNPSTGTEVDRIGELAMVVINDYISTISEAQNLAEYILKRTKVLASSATIRAIKMFELDVDKVITVTDSNLNFDKKRFLINQISIDLSIGGEMTLSVVDVDEIDFTVGSVG